MDLSVYIEPGMLMLIPVLNLTGYFVKNTKKIKSCYIPVILCVLSVILCALKTVSEKTYGDFFELIFKSITQGILTAAAAVFSNQVYKQTKAKGGNDNGSYTTGNKRN